MLIRPFLNYTVLIFSLSPYFANPSYYLLQYLLYDLNSHNYAALKYMIFSIKQTWHGHLSYMHKISLILLSVPLHQKLWTKLLWFLKPCQWWSFLVSLLHWPWPHYLDPTPCPLWESQTAGSLFLAPGKWRRTAPCLPQPKLWVPFVDYPCPSIALHHECTNDGSYFSCCGRDTMTCRVEPFWEKFSWEDEGCVVLLGPKFMKNMMNP